MLSMPILGYVVNGKLSILTTVLECGHSGHRRDAMRILDVVEAQVIESLHTGNAVTYEIGSDINGMSVTRMTFYTGEGLYIQASGGGIFFFSSPNIGPMKVMGDANIPVNPTLAAHY